MESKKAKISLAKDILIGIGILAFYFWYLIGSGSFKEITEEYLIITQEKETATGNITYAEGFEEEVQTNNKVDIVSGYAYTYTFLTSNGSKIESQSENYAELPLEKSLNDIPYEVEVEYLPNSPEINRIKGLWANNITLWDWFRQKVLFNLIMLIFCLFISYRFIKGGITSYRKYRKGATPNLDLRDYKNLTPNQQAAIRAYKKVKERRN